MWKRSGEVNKSWAVMPMAAFGVIQGFEPQRWLCECHSYIYDPAKSGGLAFEELGKKWKCPSCGAKKKKFTKTNMRTIA